MRTIWFINLLLPADQKKMAFPVVEKKIISAEKGLVLL